jgi:hypothetical protein
VFRSRKLLEAVRDMPCALCGAQDGTVVAAHSNQLRDGKGRGLKSHDFRIAGLCVRCHMAIDQGHHMSKDERREQWEEAHRATVGWLFETGKVRVA